MEVNADVNFQRRVWTAQHVGWYVSERTSEVLIIPRN
jgi:hypothetical protein